MTLMKENIKNIIYNDWQCLAPIKGGASVEVALRVKIMLFVDPIDIFILPRLCKYVLHSLYMCISSLEL